MQLIVVVDRLIAEFKGCQKYACSADKIEPQWINAPAQSFPHRKKYAVIVTGVFAMEPGREYQLGGSWKQSGRGPEFTAEKCELCIPETKEAAVAFLSSIPGIGEASSKKIVAELGNCAVKLLKEKPEALYAVKSLNRRQMEGCIKWVKENLVGQEAITLLAQCHLSGQKVKKIIEAHPDVIELLKKDPFYLSDVKGLSFPDINGICIDLNGPVESPLRIQAGIRYVQERFERRGHLCVQRPVLLSAALDLLNQGLTHCISEKVVEQEIDFLIASGRIAVQKGKKADSQMLYRFSSFICENAVAKNLSERLMRGSIEVLGDNEFATLIKGAQCDLGKILDTTQISAVRMALQSPVSIITGGPGTGKSTILKALLWCFRHSPKTGPCPKIDLCAPTGRAARRIAESTGEGGAETIHAKLGFSAGYEWSATCNGLADIQSDLLIVDEASMLDMEMAFNLIEKLSPKSKLVLVGDSDQLPSVGAGNVLAELLKTNCIPFVKLSQIYRQADTSKIIVNADKIRRGDSSFDFDDNEFCFIQKNTVEEVEETIVSMYMDCIKEGLSLDDVQILSPFKTQKKRATVPYFNVRIQELVNPVFPRQEKIRANGYVFHSGDKVMQTRNDTDVKNGDIGHVLYTSKVNDDLVAHIAFGDTEVRYTQSEMEEHGVILAYACTIHKSQGSDYHTVIIPIVKDHERFLWKNLLYTAVTRATTRVILVGQPKVFRQAALRCDVENRNTLLSQRLVHAYNRRLPAEPKYPSDEPLSQIQLA